MALSCWLFSQKQLCCRSLYIMNFSIFLSGKKLLWIVKLQSYGLLINIEWQKIIKTGYIHQYRKIKTMIEKVKCIKRKYNRPVHDAICSRPGFEIFPKMRLHCKYFPLNFTKFFRKDFTQNVSRQLLVKVLWTLSSSRRGREYLECSP